jgi:hypothetical protein
MESILDLIVKSYGIVGVILISPILAMKYLWNHNQSLQEKLQAANDKVAATESKRTDDAKEIAKTLISMAAEHAGLAKETNLALDRLGDTLTLITGGGARKPGA